MRDVAIIGNGPAGLALARSLYDRGVDALVIGNKMPWRATYGVWRDDVDDCELGAPLHQLVRGTWSTVRVVGTREHLLARPYAVFDNDALRASLAREVAQVEGLVTHVDHSLDASTIRLAGGEDVQVRLVIDATGTGEFLARRGSASGAQTAYGLVIAPGNTRHEAGAHASCTMSNSGVTDDVFTLMDWSRPPTFLYGARFPDNRVLLEETSLYAEPPHQVDELRILLAARLGADLTDTADHVERVNIPMGVPLPVRTTRVVGFGAAAGFIHPVTGYSVAASLRAAPRTASVIGDAIRGGVKGSELSLAAWDAVWPPRHVRTRAWHDAGLAVLRSLPATTIPRFFDAFFDLPVSLSAAYLRIDSSPQDVRAAMLGVFREVDGATRIRLMSSPGALLRALAAR